MMRARYVPVVLLAAGIALLALAVPVYQDMIFDSIRAKGGDAGAAGANAVIVDSPGMIEASRPSFNCSWATPVTSGDFCKFTGFTMSATTGVLMLRAGSITGFTVQCNITSYPGSGTAKFKFYKGTGTAVAMTHASLDGATSIDGLGNGDAWTSTGEKKRYVTIARNASGATFVAGEFITADVTETTLALETCNLFIEFTFDT